MESRPVLQPFPPAALQPKVELMVILSGSYFGVSCDREMKSAGAFALETACNVGKQAFASATHKRIAIACAIASPVLVLSAAFSFIRLGRNLVILRLFGSCVPERSPAKLFACAS
jgi:hypothetical protein